VRLDNYKLNPVFLWNHDVDLPPVARAEAIEVQGDEIVCQVRFPPAGISARADEIRGLVKASMINAVSVGFDPINGEPLDAKKPRAGMRVTDWEMLECSWCCVPVDPGSLVTARAKGKTPDWRCGASRNLPVEDSDAWDGAAAEASVFSWAGGDDFDPAKARKAFLAYDAANPKKRGSYKLPIAHVVDGRLKVPKGAIRAAASRLANTDIPESVREKARAVLDHYEETAGMAEQSSDRSLKIRHARALELAPKTPSFKRGLYDVASLAYLLQQLGFAHKASEYEEAMEEDTDSELPEMLGEACKVLGEALCAMTEEEVRELLEDVGGEEDDEDVPSEERAYVAEGKTPATRAWRRAIACLRAGKMLSATNAQKLEEASGHHTRALKHAKALAEHQAAVGDHLQTAKKAQSKAVDAHAAIGEALQAAKDDPTKAPEHVGHAMKAHKALGAQHEALAQAHEDADDRNQDAGDAQNGIGRSIKSAQRCVRAVVDGSTPGGEDSDSKEHQTSSGTTEVDDGDDERALRLARVRALEAAGAH